MKNQKFPVWRILGHTYRTEHFKIIKERRVLCSSEPSIGGFGDAEIVSGVLHWYAHTQVIPTCDKPRANLFMHRRYWVCMKSLYKGIGIEI